MALPEFNDLQSFNPLRLWRGGSDAQRFVGNSNPLVNISVDLEPGIWSKKRQMFEDPPCCFFTSKHVRSCCIFILSDMKVGGEEKEFFLGGGGRCFGR